MHQAFRFGLDKLDNLNYPNFLPEEIDLLLNQAQERFVKQRYGISNSKRTSFEETEKRTEDLKEVIKFSVITPTANTGVVGLTDNITEDSVFCTLPTNHWFTIWEKVIINTPNCNTGNIIVRVPETTTSETPCENCEPVITVIPAYNETVVGKYAEVRPVQHLEVDKILNDAFKAPDSDKVLRIMYEDKAEIIPESGTTVLRYILRYVKKPQSISLTVPTNCELSDHTHAEIVDEAIKIALEGVEAKRNNTFSPIVDNTKE